MATTKRNTGAFIGSILSLWPTSAPIQRLRCENPQGAMELQCRHRHQCPGHHLCGERQAIRRGAGGFATAEQCHPAGARTQEHGDGVDAVRLRSVTGSLSRLSPVRAFYAPVMSLPAKSDRLELHHKPWGRERQFRRQVETNDHGTYRREDRALLLAALLPAGFGAPTLEELRHMLHVAEVMQMNPSRAIGQRYALARLEVWLRALIRERV
jgi:hypothetical protein